MTLLSIATILWLSISQPNCFGINKATATFSVLQAISKQSALPSVVWAGKPWAGDDTPFINMRSRIDKQIAERQDPQSLLERYRSDAQASPGDSLKAFAWAYIARKTLNPWMPYEERVKTLAGVHQALLAIPFPNTYNYARMIFLIAEDDHRLIPIGERLLTQDPGDNDVKARLVASYGGLINVDGVYKKHVNAEAERRAISLSQQLIRSNHNNPTYHALLAEIYVSAYYAGKFRHPDDAKKAIMAYQQFLRLAPPNAESRIRVEAVIKELQGEMAKVTG